MSILRLCGSIGRLLAVSGLLAASLGLLASETVRGQEATPVPAATGNLASLLQLAPSPSSDGGSSPIQLASYADAAAQVAAVGQPLPTSIDDPNFIRWAYANMAILLPSNLMQYARVADWRALLGFDVWEIGQSLEVGEPPMVSTLLRGRFDEAEIRAAWAAQGYRMLDVSGVEVASLHEDAEFDITTDLGRMTFARFNNAAILDDGTLVYSPTLEGMRTLIAVAQGTEPSLGDRVDVAAVVGAIEQPLASALLLSGTALQGMPMLGLEAGATPDVDAVKTQIAGFAEMPPIVTALFGITPGGPMTYSVNETPTPQADLPASRYEIALLLPNAAAAETAARVATERLETMVSNRTLRPLTDYFSAWEARVLPDIPVVVLELTFAPETLPNVWVQMIASRDLPFLAW